jgi:hypothetical protein
MNRRFFIAWVVLFVAWMAGSFLVHGVLLHADYGQLPNLFRPETEAQRHMPLMLLAHLIMAGAFVWIYERGAENKPWLGQGLRFGLAVALLSIVPIYMIYYVVQPMPGRIVAKQIVLSCVLLLVLGPLVAWLYRTPARS